MTKIYSQPEDIERQSFAIIEAELAGLTLDAWQAPVIKRCIHTTADFDYARQLAFSPEVVPDTVALLRQGAAIVTDTQMGAAGINKRALAGLQGQLHCFMADEEVAREAKARGITRAAVSMERAQAITEPLILAIGNAPTALIRAYELIRAGTLAPKLVIGVPVGFVNVVEAKELIMTAGVPYIVNRGRKGGSNVAAAICNAMLYQIRR